MGMASELLHKLDGLLETSLHVPSSAGCIEDDEYSEQHEEFRKVKSSTLVGREHVKKTTLLA